MDIATVSTIAAHELKIQVRSRGTLIFGASFGLLALAISYFGLITAGAAGFQGFTRTTASLLNLALYMVPLFSLVAGAISFTADRGAAELLFSQPVRRGEILAGKILGLFLSMAASTLGGFGLAGAIIASRVGPEGAWRFLAFVGLTLALSLVFLAIAGLIAALSPQRAKAFGAAVVVWFFFVLFYDLLVMGLTFVLPERSANALIFLSLFGNPVDVVRVAGLMTLDGANIFGAAGAALVKYLGGQIGGYLALAVALTAWVLAPVLAARRILDRRDV